MAGYHKWGTASRLVIECCMDPLQRVVNRALEISEIDASAVQSIRDEEEQIINVAKGVSWTMDSKHIDGDGDGKVAAIDIFPYVNGKTSHHPDHYKLWARAMFQAAVELGIQIRWGGLWRGGDPFKDGPHWELA
jgi:peptidoglycan LD-endopeptidase CwlK